ncbi:endo alpha-1,4 polygalactosaminidase [Aeromicrobium panaciterrae]|uniref:endo alpha-1,4 polygalactosaminidase n=1 Tax=Aeromicrobium panaciterrae TaxID=363861 RepID=UPI0031DB8E77
MLAALISKLIAMILAAVGGGVALPPAAGVADYQLGGAYEPAASVQIVTRDRTDEPVPGRYNICYVNAFQTQPGELDFWQSRHPSLLLHHDGELLVDHGWPDEVILDLSTAAKRSEAADVVGTWFDGCVKDGYDAIEPDNLDSWTRSKGLITESDALAFASLLVDRAHASGLAIAQKNTAEWAGKDIGFDFAVAEECEVFDECGAYTETYGSHVIEIEYADAPFSRSCAERGGELSIVRRDRDVVPSGEPGYVYRTC